jgi:2-polyprenyl-3-methyl-5-hydroxy-6-metoxy-1,4-benzoquinol methylase
MRAVLSTHGFSVESYDPIFFPRADLLNFRYDFLLCCEAAEHFFYPDQEFARIHALLKPGGILAVSSRLAVPREEFAHWQYRRDPTHVIFFQQATVEWLAGRFQWEILQLESPLWLLRKT